MIFALSYLLIPILFFPFVILLCVLNNFLLYTEYSSSFHLFLFNSLSIIFPLGIWFTSLALENKLVHNLNLNKRFVSVSPVIVCFVLSYFFYSNNFLRFLENIIISLGNISLLNISIFFIAYFAKLAKTISVLIIVFYFLQFLFDFLVVSKINNRVLKYPDIKVFSFIFIISILADFTVSKFTLF